ncbi:hypothetical protein P22_0893 [Propionispora sp. 2/2-37]|uniref:diguanylate cyclase domain-containing protein n=1 Tax=Propionispora sp. 2/2-37 TaxID=1677858 RepID=UPI0006BB99DE|nr:HD domain-containing phosphohydrolase [Propionispora sp. 2/2-37]CUH94827.1 hypothetical protein P22_0893 [Propionispora sp. 2/2-37]
MKWSIVKKLLFFSIMIITIPVLALGILSYQASEKMLIDRLKDNSLQTMEFAADYFIQKYVSETEATVNLLTNSPEFMASVRSGKIDSQVIKEWENQRRFNDHIYYIYFGSENGQLAITPAWKPYSGYDLRERPWYKAACNNPGAIVWSSPYVEPASSRTVISAVKCIEEQDRLLGVFAMDTSLYRLSEIVRNMNLGTGAYAMLVNRDANVIAHDDIRQLGRNIAQEDWFTGLFQQDKRSIYYHEADRNFIVSAVNIPRTGWTLIGFIPEEAFTNEVLPIRNRTIEVGLWSIVSAIIVSMLAARKFVRRIEKLILDVKRVEKGDFSIPFADPSSDELAELNRRFRNMVSRLQSFLLQRDQTEAELQRQKVYFSQLFENSPESIAILDSHKKIIDLNKEFEVFFQYRLDEVHGKDIDEVIVPESLYEEGIAVSRAILNMEKCQIDTVRKRKDGSLVEVQVIAYPIMIDEKIMGIYCIYRDISERRKAEKQLQYISFCDVLTEVYNRNYFEREVQRLESEKQSTGYGVLVCDVDGLKLINDTLGHEKGDELLKITAGILKASLPREAILARTGGDEFAVLLAATGGLEAEAIYHRIHNKLQVYNKNRTDFAVSLSLGYATVTGGVTLKEALKTADNRMYKEKLHRSQSARSALVKTLIRALHARDFITEGHGERMQELVERFARLLRIHEYSIRDMRLLAQFHDIGKVAISDTILFKTGLLTAEEKLEMRRHSEIGYRIAIASPELNHIADWILKHHEWWDGNGYPIGLKGKEIPLECRLLAIVDAYDAMTSDRPYRKRLTQQQALAELLRCSGSMFDPELTPKFVGLIMGNIENC